MFKLDIGQLGNYVALIGFVLGLLKVNIGGEEVGQFLNAVLVLIGLCVSWYKRAKDGNLYLGSFKQ